MGFGKMELNLYGRDMFVDHALNRIEKTFVGQVPPTGQLEVEHRKTFMQTPDT